MSIPIKTYDGLRIQLDQVSYNISGATVVFTFQNGTTMTSYLANAAEAQYMLAQLDDLFGNNTPALNIVPVSPCTLISFDVNPFNAHTVSPLTITGTGFSSAILGTLHIEDASGGFDDDGMTFTVTFVDSNHITVVWASDGNGIHDAGNNYIMYYKDSLGRRSNAINLTSPDDLNFTRA